MLNAGIPAPAAEAEPEVHLDMGGGEPAAVATPAEAPAPPPAEAEKPPAEAAPKVADPAAAEAAAAEAAAAEAEKAQRRADRQRVIDTATREAKRAREAQETAAKLKAAIEENERLKAAADEARRLWTERPMDALAAHGHRFETLAEAVVKGEHTQVSPEVAALQQQLAAERAARKEFEMRMEQLARQSAARDYEVFDQRQRVDAERALARVTGDDRAMLDNLASHMDLDADGLTAEVVETARQMQDQALQAGKEPMSAVEAVQLVVARVRPLYAAGRRAAQAVAVATRPASPTLSSRTAPATPARPAPIDDDEALRQAGDAYFADIPRRK